jgi:hypothetical protein
MAIVLLERKFFKLNQRLTQIYDDFEANQIQNTDNVLNQIEILSIEEVISKKFNEARSNLLEKLINHRNHLLTLANNTNGLSKSKFKTFSFDLKLIDCDFIGNLKISQELSVYEKLKYLQFLSVRFIKLNNTFADRDLFDQSLLNERRLLIFSKLENKFSIVKLNKDYNEQTILRTVDIDKRYWCTFNAYNNRIVVRCTDEISEKIHSKINVYDENLNLLQTVKIDEKIFSNVFVTSKSECYYWSDKQQKFCVLDLKALEQKFSFGQNESTHVNDGPLECISSERIYIRNETRRGDNKRTIDVISRSTGKLINTISCGSMNIFFKVDNHSRLYINSYQQGSPNKIECFDLNGCLLFRNVYDFYQAYRVDFSHFNFLDEHFISFFNFDRKNIIFV